MQYSKFEEFMNFTFVHRKKVVFILSFLILSFFLISFKESYSQRVENQEFNEIQNFLLEIREKDEEIYNPLKTRIINKTVKGIDVSSWQGEIDWEKVKAAGVEFVMIRCGFRNLGTPEIVEDKTFKYNISEANRLDIPVGIYFYSTAMDSKEVYEEATFVLNLIKDYKITYPVVYDFETFGIKRTKDVSDKRINDNAVKFLDYFRAHGYEGMLYTNLTTLENRWDLEKFEGYKLWYAQYIDSATYEGHYDMWQYSDRGRVDGIVGNVDLNESYFAYEIIE